MRLTYLQADHGSELSKVALVASRSALWPHKASPMGCHRQPVPAYGQHDSLVQHNM